MASASTSWADRSLKFRRMEGEYYPRRVAERVTIVGGGIAGLTAASALAEDPAREVVVLERAPRAGGHLHSERIDGFLLEWGPHSLSEDSAALGALIVRLDLASRIERAGPAARERYVVRDGIARKAPAS